MIITALRVLSWQTDATGVQFCGWPGFVSLCCRISEHALRLTSQIVYSVLNRCSLTFKSSSVWTLHYKDVMITDRICTYAIF